MDLEFSHSHSRMWNKSKQCRIVTVNQPHYRPEVPRVFQEVRFPDLVITAQDGCKVVSLTHRPPLPRGNTPGTHFCSRLSRSQGHSAIGRILCQ